MDENEIEDDQQNDDDEDLLLPLPNIKELKLKKFAANKLLNKAKRTIRRKSYQIKKSAKTQKETEKPQSSSSQLVAKRLVLKSNDSNDYKIISLYKAKPKQTVQDVIQKSELKINSVHGFQKKIDIPLIIRNKASSSNQSQQPQPQSSKKLIETSLNPKESLTEALRKTRVHIPHNITSFPKAIIYPDKNKAEIQQVKTKQDAELSFNKVFTMSAEKKKPVIKSSNSTKTSVNSIQKKQNGKVYEAVYDSDDDDDDDLEEENEFTQPFKYAIPQDMLLSENDKVRLSNSSSSSVSSSSSEDEEDEGMKSLYKELKKKLENTDSDDDDDDSSQLQKRPKENLEMIDLLAEYRSFAINLFQKIGMEPIDFDNNDDYINMYKIFRK